MAHISAVCVLHTLHPDPDNPDGTTSIDKRALAGPVAVGALGLSGDRQSDTENHGGADQAVYLYADEDADWWAAELGRAIAPGLFGENLRTSGIDLNGTRIGQQVGIGDTLILEVTAPRTPCATFARRMGEPHWVRRFTQRRAPGAYARVVVPGVISVGDEVVPLGQPDHDVTVADVLPPVEPRAFARLLDAERAGAVVLSDRLRRKALKSVSG
ncbi:MAG: MOSC domain-containing protein [Candidatus Nanopelagicales bacterium]|jgi:MOSC domain-containing protein YiiM|nr:MOSC domain-containing protein [Candidatus Nanopelagicales bacterium]